MGRNPQVATHQQAANRQERPWSVKLSLIVAISENGVIGRKGQLPWRLSADLARFRQLTMGHHLVMGRKTFESIGRALPGRTSLVISRQSAYSAPGAVVVPDLQRALDIAQDDSEVFVIGGGEIYRQALPLADRIYLTRVHAVIEGETTFPDLPGDQWRLVEQSPRQSADEKNEFDHSLFIYERARSWSGGDASG